MPAGRDELAHRRGMAVGSRHHAQDEILVAGIEDPAQDHGEPALEFAAPALGHESGEFRRRLTVEVGGVVERHRVPVLGDAVVGLAQALHVPAGQGEFVHVDDGLVADVDVVHPRGPVDGQPVLAGAHHADDPPPVVGEAAERGPHLLLLGEGPDGIGRDQADAAVDGVRHHGVAVEEPLLVAAQGEVVQRSLAVAPDDVPGACLRRPARRSAAVDEGAGGQDHRHHGQGHPHGEEAGREKVVEPVGEGHAAQPDEALEHRLAGAPQGQAGTVEVEAQRELHQRAHDHGDAHDAARRGR